MPTTSRKPPSRRALTVAGRSPTWPALRDVWRAYLDREQSEATRIAYVHAVDRFAAWLAERRRVGSAAPAPASLASVSAADVSAWRDVLRRRYSLATVSLYLSGVRAFYAWAIQKGAPISNPAAGVKGKGRKGLGAHKRDTFTDDEIRAILASCSRPASRRDLALLSLMAYTGIRTIEAQRVEVGDLESKGGRLILWVWGKGHGGPDDFVVLPGPAEAALRDWLAHHPKGTGPLFCSHITDRRGAGRSLTLRQFRRIILEHIRAAGIRSPRKTAHSLRHTAITNAIRHGATPIQAQRMARHLDIKTTLAYYHEADRLTDPAEDRITYDEESS